MGLDRSKGPLTQPRKRRLAVEVTDEYDVRLVEVEPGPSDKGYVKHDASPDVARPIGFGSVEWQGSVEPLNALNGDTWIVTS